MSEIVLIHGAWSAPFVWERTAAALAAHGHRVATPTLPHHDPDAPREDDVSLADYVDTVLGAIDGLGGRAVLVGHSMAGVVLSQVAETRPEAVSHLVYLAALLLPDGQSLYGFTQSSPGMAESLLGPALRPGDDGLGVDPAAFVDAFCADAPADDAARALAALRPEPLAPLGTPVSVTDGRWGSVPRTYVHTSADRCVSLASQQEMVAALPTPTRTLAASHLAMLAAPGELAALVHDLTSSEGASS